MTRKLVSLLLALAMLLSATAALAEVTYPISDEPIDLSYWCSIHSSALAYISSYEENEAYQEMEKRTGIDLHFIHPASGQEKVDFQLMISDPQSMPDIIQYDSVASAYDGGLIAAMDEGVIVDLTDLLPVWAPDYWELVKDNPLFQTSDGRYAAVYKVNYGPYDPAWPRMATRADFLAEYGKPEPQTIAELEDYFQWILDNKPGVTPLMLPTSGSACWDLVYGAFGILGNWYVDADSKVQHGYASENYRLYLETLHRWFEKGYLVKDYITMAETEVQSNFAAGKIATVYGAPSPMRSIGQSSGFETQLLPYTIYDENSMFHFMWLRSPNQGNPAVITTNCKNVEAALKFLNYGYTKEGSLLYNYGVEGLSWNYNEDGKPTYTDRALKPENFSVSNANYIYRIHFAPKLDMRATDCNLETIGAAPGNAEYIQQWTDDPKIDMAFRLPTEVSLTSEENNRRAEIMTDLTTFAKEQEILFINGERDLATFDEYMEEIMDMDYEEAREITQAAYDRCVGK